MLIGNGNVERKEYNISETFASIIVNGTVDVRLTEGDSLMIEVETDENLHHTEAIQISVDQNSLTVQDHDCRYTKMIVYIRFPPSQGLKSLTFNGAGLGQSTNQISATDLFTVTINGTRKINLKLDAKADLQLEMNGTAQLTLAGAVQQAVNIKQSGTTKLNAKECQTSRVTAVLQGVSTAFVVAQDEINVNVQGVSGVFYRGPLKRKIVGAITCKVQEF
jgi:hypothetical protein